MQQLNLALGANRGYALPLAVTLASLLETRGKCYSLRLFLCQQGLPPEFLRRLARHVDLELVAMPAATVSNPRYPPEALTPLWLDRLLPQEVDRVLFLDSDLLILDDIEQLWERDLKSKCVAAVQDQAFAPPYFNAGVMLLDLTRIRLSGLFVEAARRLCGRRFLHQEILNEQLSPDGWTRLPARWNVIAGINGRFVPKVERPAVVHFAGRAKPWRSCLGGEYAASYRATMRDNFLWPAPAVKGSWQDWLLAHYDSWLRRWLYPLERWAWRRGWV